MAIGSSPSTDTLIIMIVFLLAEKTFVLLLSLFSHYQATDETYLEKMMNKHLGKHQSFGKPKPSKNKKAGVPDPHFEIHHYAGTVGYNVTGWLFKNKVR